MVVTTSRGTSNRNSSQTRHHIHNRRQTERKDALAAPPPSHFIASIACKTLEFDRPKTRPVTCRDEFSPEKVISRKTKKNTTLQTLQLARWNRRIAARRGRCDSTRRGQKVETRTESSRRTTTKTTRNRIIHDISCHAARAVTIDNTAALAGTRTHISRPLALSQEWHQGAGCDCSRSQRGRIKWHGTTAD